MAGPASELDGAMRRAYPSAPLGKSMVFSIVRLSLLTATVTGALLQGACSIGSPAKTAPLPDPDTTFSWFGAGSRRLDKKAMAPIFFDGGDYKLMDSEREKVAEYAGMLREDPRRVLLAGFTDDGSTPEFSRVLGERRALEVRNALIHDGVPAAFIHTVSFGESYPVGTVPEKNRRVEIGLVR